MIPRASQRSGRAAFTLIELLVVIGLLAVFATISVAGYSAASRGMTDRGVAQSTASALRVAQQTCLIDHVPTKVLFLNQRLTSEADKDDDTLCQGTVIGIKQAGRITIGASQTDDGLLIDEFADWHQSYPPLSNANGPGMRIYHMGKNAKELSGCSSIVRPSVKPHQLTDDYLVLAGRNMTEWCKDHNLGSNDRVWGFQIMGGGLGAGEWNAGDAYGVEIVRIDLPKGYIFGTKVPKDSKSMELVAVAHFVPDDLDSKLRPNLKGDEVQISLVQTALSGSSRLTEVGKVSSKMLRDD